MDVFEIRDEVVDDYRSFAQGFLQIRDPGIRRKVQEELDSGLLWPEPWLALNPSFEPGGTIDDLVKAEVLHPTSGDIFRLKRDANDKRTCSITLHQHQREAIEVAANGDSYVVATGTGSGKSLTYILPGVDHPP